MIRKFIGRYGMFSTMTRMVKDDEDYKMALQEAREMKEKIPTFEYCYIEKEWWQFWK